MLLHPNLATNARVHFQTLLIVNYHINLLGDSRNYMPPILVPSSTKRIGTQILVTTKLNGRKDFILKGFFCDIIRPNKESSVESY